MIESFKGIIEGAGFFIYPLSVCSVLAVFLIFERLFSLRTKIVVPNNLYDKLLEGEIPKSSDEDSTAGRILSFYLQNGPDAEALKAYAKLQVAKLERGLFILDIIIAGAPLMGLLGTVIGLVQVFSSMSLETSIPEQASFVKGIALALTTTMLGLMIAIPALVGNGYLGRRVEMLSAKLEVFLERLLNLTTPTLSIRSKDELNS